VRAGVVGFADLGLPFFLRAANVFRNSAGVGTFGAIRQRGAPAPMTKAAKDSQASYSRAQRAQRTKGEDTEVSNSTRPGNGSTYGADVSHLFPSRPHWSCASIDRSQSTAIDRQNCAKIKRRLSRSAAILLLIDREALGRG
jgi:hypothetical protein